MARRVEAANLMDDKDIRALRQVVRIYGQDVDFDLFLHGLLRQGFIKRLKYEHLSEILNNAAVPVTNRYETCLRELAQLITLQNIVSVLNDIGLQHTAEAILKERYRKPENQVKCKHYENQTLIENLYVKLLQKRSSGSIHISMNVDFQNMTTYFLSRLQESKDIRKRQRFIDCLAIVACMRGFILETRSKTNEAILNELMSVKESHKDLDDTVITAVYLISKVYIAGESYLVDEGEACLVQVKQVCHYRDNLFFRTLIYTAQQAFHRRIYSQTADTTYQHKCLLACDSAMYSIGNTVKPLYNSH